MSTTLFVRRFLADYARNPVNMVMLVVVPVVFVVVAAGSMAEAARVLGGGSGPAVQTATAGWAAGFLSAIAMYFQVRSARAADRRLVLAGLPAPQLVGARLLTGFALALMVSAAALTALAARDGIASPVRVIIGTVMFAVIYLAIGALVGALVRNPVNGTVLILFVWIVDVFFGPAIASSDRLTTRGLPTHFVTLWMVDLPSGHGGRIGDLGWAAAWTFAALAVGWAVVTLTSQPRHRSRRHTRAGSVIDQLMVGIRMGLRDYRRNPVLWILLVGVPVLFVLMAKAITPNKATSIILTEAGRSVRPTFWLPDVHAGTMTPIAVAALAALAGLFVGLDSRAGDQRLKLAGFRASTLLTARLAVIGAAVLLITAASLAVTATVFSARQWFVFAIGNALVAATYALVGVSLGPIFGRISGVLIAFMLPFLDMGIAQSPMLRAQPAGWAHYLPGYGPERVLLDGGLTGTFDTTGPLVLALVWLVGLGIVTVLLFRRPAPTRNRSQLAD